MRLVLDTNTVVSALLWQGTPHILIEAVRTRPIPVFTSPVLLAELAGVLMRKKLVGAVNASGATPEELMQRYRRLAAIIHPAPIPPTVLTDSDDDHVLACALSAKADLIVSGDRDLLALNSFNNIPIVTAADAIKTINAQI